MQDAQVNALTSRLPNASTKMFLLQAFFGIGACVAPIISTIYIQHYPTTAYSYYFISFGVAIFTLIALVVVFQGRTDDQVASKSESQNNAQEGQLPVVGGGSGSGAKMKRILGDPKVYLLLCYSFIYVSKHFNLHFLR